MNEAPENGIEEEAKSLHKDQRGAVLAEFVLVLAPMLTMFFVFAQLSAMASARLMLKHSAVVAVRAAAVYSNTGDNVPEASGSGGGDVTSAAQAALGTWNRSFTGVSTTVNDTSTRGDDDNQYDLVTVTVSATYRCEVPLGKIICGAGGTRAMQDTKSMPHQGARYRTE